LKQILVTGGSGYIGSRLVPALETLGNSVDVVDIGWFSTPAGGAFQEANIDSYDAVIHLAGHSSVGMCESDPDGAWRNNVESFRELVSRLRSDQLLVYASSGSVYGNIGRPAVESDAGLSAVHEYDLTKVVGDVIATRAIGQGKQIVGLRFGTVNGLSPYTRVDLMLNAMCLSAVKHGVVNVKNLSIARPLLFLDDLVQAVDLILGNPVPGIFNLASVDVTVEEAAQAVIERTGAERAILLDDDRPYDFHLDVSRFVETYGAFCSASLEDTIESLVDGVLDVDCGTRHRPGSQELPRLR
jgi:nucleoside-diphosphate-sugar epimerase